MNIEITSLPRCPKISLTVCEPGPRNDLNANGTDIIDLIAGPIGQKMVTRRAVDVGIRKARQEWYQLRNRLASIKAIVARDGCSVQWGQPWPSDAMTVHIYIVRGNLIEKSLDVDFFGARVDVLLRRATR